MRVFISPGVWASTLLVLSLSACQVSPIPYAPGLPTRAAPLASDTASSMSAQSAGTAADRYEESRQRMITVDLEGRGIADTGVLSAMRKVPRHEFVLPGNVNSAYADHALPIGHGQTISQPYIVAKMTELLRLKPGQRVLEIGTGSGYQAAILAELTDQVYTVEIIAELHERARAVFQRLGYTQVQMLHADGYYGWPEFSPYDAIIVTAAPDHIPQPLVQQLSDGGRLVVPVGPQGSYQTLWLIEKHGDKIVSTGVMGVVFVPLTGAGVKSP